MFARQAQRHGALGREPGNIHAGQLGKANLSYAEPIGTVGHAYPASMPPGTFSREVMMSESTINLAGRARPARPQAVLTVLGREWKFLRDLRRGRLEYGEGELLASIERALELQPKQPAAQAKSMER